MHAFENTELNIRVHPGVAISTGVATLQASLDSRDISGPERFTRSGFERRMVGWLSHYMHHRYLVSEANEVYLS